MKNVLITGATSFIGVHLINECINNNCRVIAVVRPNSEKIIRLPKSNLITIIETDMERIEDLVDKIRHVKVDVFYHLAWDGVRGDCRNDTTLQDKNYMCSINAMDVAKQLGCSRFIGTGSQAEYGTCIGSIDESYPTNPVSEYGKAKLKTYKTLKAIAKENDIKFLWARIFSVYGIYDYEGTLVMSALSKMKKNEAVQLTECTQSWDFIYVEDVARIMYLLSNINCEEGIYNIASGETRKLKDFVIAMKEVSKSTSELHFGAIPYSSEGVISFEPRVDKLKRNLGYTCRTKFEDGIDKILKFIY
ncbi:GDP-6-deoxy-D-mannose reductase [bioreactor metagenome]|uniref:GDP-6-deoxy-D-mannose reductase n=1 Tax=bioreactor metagenome TaxID=1076179 RepID=A0A644ZIY5_9ZZZZ